MREGGFCRENVGDLFGFIVCRVTICPRFVMKNFAVKLVVGKFWTVWCLCWVSNIFSDILFRVEAIYFLHVHDFGFVDVQQGCNGLAIALEHEGEE
ncbi:hypothetical protein RYX36_029817 [Vicia faba]